MQQHHWVPPPDLHRHDPAINWGITVDTNELPDSSAQIARSEAAGRVDEGHVLAEGRAGVAKTDTHVVQGADGEGGEVGQGDYNYSTAGIKLLHAGIKSLRAWHEGSNPACFSCSAPLHIGSQQCFAHVCCMHGTAHIAALGVAC